MLGSKAWLLHILFSFAYFVVGLYLLGVAPDYYTRCDEDPNNHTCRRCAPHAPAPMHGRKPWSALLRVRGSPSVEGHLLPAL